MKSALFMIEGGKPLEMVKEYIRQYAVIKEQTRLLAEELGVSDVWTDISTGVMTAVLFKGEVHPEFKKPKKRGGPSYPKKGSSWAKRFADQQGTRNPAEWISKEFNVPMSLRYKGVEDGRGHGWRCIGNPLRECGFLFLSEDGPYALWIPDVAAEVAYTQEQGCIIEGEAATFKMEIPGCRRIHDEEWEILVLQHKLAEKEDNG